MARLSSKKKEAADFYTRMPLRFEKEGAVAKTDDGKEGWIEYWHTDAKACRDPLRRVTAEIYAMEEGKRRRKEGELTVEQAIKELDRMNELTVHGLALRVKDWFLVTDEGDHVDVPVSVETAKEILDERDEDDENLPAHDLKGVSIEHLGKPENFTLKASRKPAPKSASSPASTSKDS